MKCNADDDDDDQRLTWWRSVKRSVRSVLLGVALCGAAAGTLLLSEGRAVRFAHRLDAVAAQAADADAAVAAIAHEAPPRWKWRGVAFGMTAVGAWLVLRPIATASNVMPLVGSVVREAGLMVTTGVSALTAVCGMIGVNWIEVRPFYGVIVTGVALAAAAWLKTHADLRRSRRRRSRGTPKLKEDVLQSVPRAQPFDPGRAMAA